MGTIYEPYDSYLSNFENASIPENGGTAYPLLNNDCGYTYTNIYGSTLTLYISLLLDGEVVTGRTPRAFYAGTHTNFIDAPLELWQALEPGSSHTRQFVLRTGSDVLVAESSVWSFTIYEDTLSKPTTPSPANGSGPGINFATRTVSWVDGGGAETYTVRMDPGDTPYNVVSLSQTGTSYTIPEADISRYKDNIISWRVDAEAGGETVTGDVWTFDPRPAKATTPSPTNGASNTALNLTTLSWVKDAYTDTSEVNCSWSGSVSLFSTSSNSIALANYTPLYMDRLGYSNTYTWSVDTTNEWGTTEGDDWTFDTISYSGASCSWTNYDGKTLGPFDGGVESVDYYWTGDNCISTVKRVIAFAGDRVWITEV